MISLLDQLNISRRIYRDYHNQTDYIRIKLKNQLIEQTGNVGSNKAVDWNENNSNEH